MDKSSIPSLLLPRPGVAALPSVDRLQRLKSVQLLVDAFGQQRLNDAVRALLADKRAALLSGAVLEAVWPPGEQWIEKDLRQRLEAAAAPRLRRVFNLTGTVLHTNLGRAPMPEEAVQAVATAMRSAVNLELDLTLGGRGERDELVERLLCELTGWVDHRKGPACTA